MYNNTKFLWALILFLALFLRIIGITLNPVGLNHDDELHEIINAKSLALTGSHAPGRVAGILTVNDNCPGNCVYGELGSFLFIPWMLIFPLSLFWSKIPFIIASVCLVFFTGKLFENLSKNTKVGLLAGVLVAINPWAIHFGRTAYFTIFSYMFYITAAYFFTKNKFISSLILGTISSVVASLFYFGTKPILPLIFLWGIIYNLYKSGLENIRFITLLSLIVFIFIAGYIFILSNSYAGRRIQEIGPGSPEAIKAQIDYERRTSLDIPILGNLFTNKYILQTTILTQKYLGFFSPAYLFLKTEGDTDNYYISNQSYNYLIDFPFLIMGIVAISTNISGGLMAFSLLVIAAVPAALKITGDTIYALRVGLAYPILSGFSGWGIYYCYSLLLKFDKKNNLKRFSLHKIFILIIGVIYILSLIYFLVMYWYRTPFEKAAGMYFHKRIVANYITRFRSISDKKIYVVTAQPDATFNTYIFYSGIYNKKIDIEQINQSFINRSYEFRNTKFIDDCKKITDQDLKGSVIFIEQGDVKCTIFAGGAMEIANPRDSGGLYKILNESLCTNFLKNKYPYPRKITDFQVDTLSDEQFCKMWITNPNQ